MIYLSSALVLTTPQPSPLTNPVFLWQNLVTPDAIEADHELDTHPASNLANPQTFSRWKSGSTAAQTISFDIDGDRLVDSVGIARHNFGSGGVLVAIEGITADDGADWEELASFAPGDDGAILALFAPGYYVGIRLLLTPQDVAPEAAVVYVGKALIMPRSVPEGFVLPGDALEREVLDGTSENGDFAGDIVQSERLAFTVEFELLDGVWFRTNMRAFTLTADPFFYGFSPLNMPTESAFTKFPRGERPKGQVNHFTGHVDIAIPLTGLAL